MVAVFDMDRRNNQRIVFRPIGTSNGEFILESDSMIEVRLISGPTLSLFNREQVYDDPHSCPLGSFYNLFEQDLQTKRSLL